MISITKSQLFDEMLDVAMAYSFPTEDGYEDHAHTFYHEVIDHLRTLHSEVSLVDFNPGDELLDEWIKWMRTQ